MYDAVAALERCGSPEDRRAVGDAVRRVLALIGGLESLIATGDVVLIKPNVGFEMNYLTGATTNPNVVEAVAAMALECGARRVIIGEGAAVSQDTGKAYEANGYVQMASRLGLRLVDFRREERTTVLVPFGRAFRRLAVPRVVLESDVIVSIPVAKTHDALPVTLSLKNMKGVLSDADKQRFHRRGLAQSISDLNKVAGADCALIDGTIGMEGFGPAHGTPAGLGFLVGSRDALAADVVAAAVMGFSLDEVDYLRLAQRDGLGCADLDRIEVRGASIAEVMRPVRRSSVDFAEYQAKGIRVYGDGSCTGCRYFIGGYLKRLEDTGQLSLLEGRTIAMGDRPCLPSDVGKGLMLLGKCTKPLEESAKRLGVDVLHVPGCPPHAGVLAALLRGGTARTARTAGRGSVRRDAGQSSQG